MARADYPCFVPDFVEGKHSGFKAVAFFRCLIKLRKFPFVLVVVFLSERMLDFRMHLISVMLHAFYSSTSDGYVVCRLDCIDVLQDIGSTVKKRKVNLVFLG